MNNKSLLLSLFILLLCFCKPSICSEGLQKHNREKDNFDTILERTCKEKPHLKKFLKKQTIEKDKNKPSSELIDADKFNSLLNTAGTVAICYLIYKRYKFKQNNDLNDDKGFIHRGIETIMKTIMPNAITNLMKQLGQNTILMIDSFEIVVKVLVYKSVVKLIAFSIKADAADLLREGIRKTVI